MNRFEMEVAFIYAQNRLASAGFTSFVCDGGLWIPGWWPGPAGGKFSISIREEDGWQRHRPYQTYTRCNGECDTEHNAKCDTHGSCDASRA